jgi:hypothetical protein
VKTRTWTESQLRRAVKNSRSIRQVLKALKLREAGGNYAQIKKYLHFYKVDTSNIKGRGWNKGLRGIGHPKLSLAEILVRGSTFQSYKLRNRLFLSEIKAKHCEKCGWAERSLDGRLPLELDHINGDSTDNRLSNLRILCPNCHSLQPTHRGRNRK